MSTNYYAKINELMGTNYYAKINECKCCGRYEILHIGKSSAGWCFSLHVYPEDGINTLEDWKMTLKHVPIINEYGEDTTLNELIKVITKRSWNCKNKLPPGYLSWGTIHQHNHSEEGPNGLLRHRIDGKHCVGHGDGTYDYMVGNFS